MKNVSALSALTAVLAVMGCQGRHSNEAMTADLERDLSLATAVHAPHTGVVSAIEQTSNGGPSGNESGRRLAVPTKRRAPSPAKSPVVTEVAEGPAPTQEATATASTTVEPTAVAQEAPAPVTTAPAPDPGGVIIASGPSAGTGNEGSGHGDMGRGNDGHRGVGGVVGGIIGVIIRDSSAGVDNCEPPTAGRRGPLDRGGIIGTIIGGAVRGQGGMRMPGSGGMPRYPRY